MAILGFKCEKISLVHLVDLDSCFILMLVTL